MNAIQDAYEALRAALDGLPGLHLCTGITTKLDPPAVVVDAPGWDYDTFGGPSKATFTVWVIVPLSDAAFDALMRFVDPVADAIDAVANAAVMTAAPQTYVNAGAASFPAYALTVEVGLS